MKVGVLITKVVMDEIIRSKCMNPCVSLADWDRGLINPKVLRLYGNWMSLLQALARMEGKGKERRQREYWSSPVYLILNTCVYLISLMEGPDD
jgi:hypothetical protein